MSFDADFYARLRSTATRLLTQRGQVCTLTHYGAAVVDDDSGAATQPETTALVAGVLTTYTDKNTGSAIADRAAGTLIDERRLSITAETINAGSRAVTGLLSFEPKAGDSITADGEAWRITECKPTNPAGIPVSFELRVKRG